MTDKEQIIIDGVDVSGCENYKPNNRFTCHPHICNCHERPSCYFKQLARKTQECEGYLKALEEIERYCRRNRQAGWVDIEGIHDIISKAKGEE